MLAFGLAMAAMGFGPLEADAGPVACENFHFDPMGAVQVDDRGGLGLSGPWHSRGFGARHDRGTSIASDALQFDILLTGGDSLLTGSLVTSDGALGGIHRELSSRLVDGTTVYPSVLSRREGTPNRGASSGFVGSNLNATPRNGNGFSVGKTGGGGGGGGSPYVRETRGGDGQVSSGVSAVVGRTALQVPEPERTADNDQSTVYLESPPGEPESASNSSKSDGIEGVLTGPTLGFNGAFPIDEIRPGDPFTDITPTLALAPEPSTLRIAGTGDETRSGQTGIADVTLAPEPSTLVMAGTGLVLALVYSRRRSAP